MIDVINALISEKLKYGYELKTIDSDFFSIICWSNGGKSWFLIDQTKNLYLQAKLKGDEIQLDSNQVLVPFKYYEVRKILDKLDNLPLYKKSFEFK